MPKARHPSPDLLHLTRQGASRRIRVVYILAYRSPLYIRTQSILQAISNHPSIELLIASNRSIGLQRYIETWRALRLIRKIDSPDIYLLGFRGHEIFWPVRWLARDKPLMFDALMSPSAALSEEGKAGPLGRIIAPLLRFLERRILQRSDLVLTDTSMHADFYETRFGLPKGKIVTLPVGAIESSIHPVLSNWNRTGTKPTFNVLFYGSMLPLHGIDTIVSAAAKLRDLPIRFDFIGGNAKQARRLNELCTRQKVTRYTYRGWVPMQELVSRDIPCADLCLGGPFGGTPQALRVITGKTSQCLALGKATVIGKINEYVGLQDKTNCLLVPQADPDALADAIRWGFMHQNLLSDIGKSGQILYYEKFSSNAIASALIPAIERLYAERYGQP